MNQTYRLTGTRPKADSTVEIEDCIAFISYPTPTTWQADIILEAGRRNYNYRTITDDIESSWTTLEIELQSEETTQIPAYNILDEHGVLFDTQRITGERNENYKARLLDVFKHRGGPDFVGFVNAICRDLDLDYEDQALKITRDNNPDTGDAWVGVLLEITDSFVKVSHPSFVVVRERLSPDPIEGYLAPLHWVMSDLLIEDGNHQIVSDYRWDGPRNRVYLLDPTLAGQDVYLTYRYEERIYRLDKTLQDIADELEATLTPNGDSILTVVVASGFEDKSAEGLSILPSTEIVNRHFDASGEETLSLPIRWSDVYLHQVWDGEFQDRNRTPWGSLHNTRSSAYAHSLIKLAKATWGELVGDESVWGSELFPIAGGQFLDTNTDARLGFWRHPTDSTIYDAWQRDGEVVEYQGPPEDYFQSGVGDCLALKVVIGSSSRGVGTEDEQPHIVSDTDLGQSVPDGNLPTEGGLEIA